MISMTLKPQSFCLLTISDTRDLSNDKSGAVLAYMIKSDGHRLCERQICRDDIALICEHINAFIDRHQPNAVITTGGTGLTGRDVTIEAHRTLYDKEITAFGPLFSQLSWHKIGSSALQSRATAGVYRATYLFALPGSPSACKDAWQGLLSPQFDSNHKPCNFVEIADRLNES